MSFEKPIIGVTMGDPVGIGPEIVLKALKHREIYDLCYPVLVGDPVVFRKINERCGLGFNINTVEEGDLRRIRELRFEPGVAYLVDIKGPDLSDIEFGVMNVKAAEATYLTLAKSVELAMMGLIDAVATAPINKQEMHLKYKDFIGHTEFLQQATGAPIALTMFQLENMRVFFLTRHVALRDIFKYIKKENILAMLRAMNVVLNALGIKNPRIAVAALNPHASDGGLFGDEELTEIQPAVDEAKKEGINVEGPIPADSVFWQGRQGKYDAILSLYHDQGHIATKTVDFYKTVSVTLGLPFIRTSPDHGTVYSRAGKCTSSEISMKEAIILAAKYARPWREAWSRIKDIVSTALTLGADY
ncbi:MAG: 4-hydroxythreonine-4-phosphate dehydrogenase PdxA [Sulfolobales archaeon]